MDRKREGIKQRLIAEPGSRRQLIKHGGKGEVGQAHNDEIALAVLWALINLKKRASRGR